MAEVAFRAVMGLYQAVIGQREVVNEQQATVQLLEEANLFLEVERLFSVDMQEETERLGNAQGILDDLNAQLSQAIAAWNHLASEEASQAQSHWAPYPGIAVSQLSLNKPLPHPPTVSRSNGAFRSGNSAMDSCIHYHSQQPANMPSFPYKSRPTQWWMQEKDHYGLCQQNEQGQLEGAARAAQFNRAHLPAHHHSAAHQVSQAHHHSFTPSFTHQASQTQHHSFPQTVSQAQHHSFTQKVSQAQHRQAPPPALQLPPPAASMPHRGADWSEPDEMWLDNGFDPEFWQKHFRADDLWTRHPRRAIPEEDNLSPRTLPPGPRI